MEADRPQNKVSRLWDSWDHLFFGMLGFTPSALPGTVLLPVASPWIVRAVFFPSPPRRKPSLPRVGDEPQRAVHRD